MNKNFLRSGVGKHHAEVINFIKMQTADITDLTK